MLRPGKGHAYWLRSMPAVLRRWPNARFVLAGDGGERTSLEAEAARLGIVPQVDFLGCIDHAGLGELLSQWDVFVLPSLNEPLGIVLVEAMAAALPIVATRAGGVVELLCDEQTALLVPPRDSEGLAAAQLRLAADPQLRARLGRAARRAYEQGPFTAGQVGSAVAQIYWAALGGGAGQRSSAAGTHR
jgi:glycosyltransferase involved in cell wall biosynthesis